MDWWIWIGGGLVLLIFEIVTAMLVFGPFAIGAFTVGIAAALGVESFNTQLVVFSLGSTVLVLLSRTLLRNWLVTHSPGSKVKTNVDRYAGQIGVVLAPVDNVHEEGQVRFEGLEWRARSSDGRRIAGGARVRIVRVEGATLIVEEESIGRQA